MDRLRQVFPPLTRRRTSTPPQKKVFGSSLEDVNYSIITAEGQHVVLPVPFIVHRISTYLYQSGGVSTEGIFRINGNAKVVDTFKHSFERTGDAHLEHDDDHMAAASCLKNYLRELSESLVPERYNADFLALQDDLRHPEGQFINRLKDAVYKLPSRNIDLLKYIMRFLVDVSENPSNRMTARGLAIVFGPNIFRPSNDLGGLRDQGVFNDITTIFIEKYSEVFGSLDEFKPYEERLSYVPFNKKSSSKDKENKSLYEHSKSNTDHSSNNNLCNNKSRQPPARPPPPKISDCVPLIVHPDADDLRPVTAQSSEFMERASPMTIGDTDGHSSIASPVLSAVAAELVTKTISEAVLEHIFQVPESQVKSIFDHWGNDSEADPSELLQNGHHELKDRPVSQSTHTYHSASNDRESKPQPRPRTSRQPSREENTDDLLQKPTPKPRTKSAPIRTDTLTLHQSIIMPLVNGGAHLINSESSNHEHIDSTDGVTKVIERQHVDVTQSHLGIKKKQSDLDTITSDVVQLSHYKRPKGPANRKPRSRRSMHSSSDDATLLPNDFTSHDVADYNNNHGAELRSHENTNTDQKNHTALPDGNATAKEPEEITTKAVVQKIVKETKRGKSSKITKTKHSDENPDNIEPPKINGVVEEQPLTNGVKDDQSSNSPPAASTEPPAVQSTEPPAVGSTEPPATPVKSEQEEQRAQNIKSLSRRINVLKKKIRTFEDHFETEHGSKPTTHDKNAKIEIKKAMAELAKARKELKALKELDRAESSELNEQRTEGTSQRPDSIVHTHTSEPPTMGETLDLLLKKLKEKRTEAKRSEDLSSLNRDQIQEEKVAVQKALLHFESIHGRPQTKSEKELMRPLYDRYRQIKKVLQSPAVTQPAAPPPTEHKNVETAIKPDAEPRTGETTTADKDEERSESPSDQKNHLQELSVQELKLELDKVNIEKKKLRKILRDFEDEFSSKHGRKVQKDDRGPMSKEYTDYKHVKAKIKLLEALLAKEG